MEYQNNINNSDDDGYNESGSYNDDGYNRYNGGNFYNNGSGNGQGPNYGIATASMICGILSIIFSCCYGIIGLILGIISIIFVFIFKKSNNGYLNNQTIAGIVCSIIGIILSVIMLIYIIWVFTHYQEFMNIYEWILSQNKKV